jgi:anti-sigma factor RsiW
MNCRDIADLSPLYHSRELAAAQLREFESHLGRCRSCALELERQASMDARLRAAVDHEMPETAALDRSIMERISTASSRRREFSRWFIGAAAAAVLLIACSAWWAAVQKPAPRLYADAARDHQMEVVQHQPRRWRSGAAEIDALAARYGLSGKAAATLGPAGFRLEHAKTCGLEGRPVLHLVYSNGAREVSLYLRRNDSVRHETTASSDLREVIVGTEYLDAFRTERFTAVIVAEGSRADCLRFARSASMIL